jgi:hypothetical protein
LKINVDSSALDAIVSSRPKILNPAQYSTKQTIVWYSAWQMIILTMSTLMRGAVSLSGLRSSEERVAGSVASARAANVSMIRLTQRSWTGVRMALSLSDARAETKVTITATILTLHVS